MGRQIKGLLYFIVADAKRSFLIFWSILIATLIGTIFITYVLFDVNQVQMYFSLTFATTIYCSIFGFLSVRETIPFSIKMGATRTNLFISLGLFFITLAVVKALLANTIHEVVLILTKKLSFNSFGFIHPAQLIENTWFTRVLIDSATMFFFLTVMFGIALLFYKYGLIGGGIVVAAILASLLTVFTGGYLTDFVVNIAEGFSLKFFYQLFGITIILYVLTWFLIRNVTTNKRI